MSLTVGAGDRFEASFPRERFLGWIGIIRLGLVQASIGAIVVLATSTMNRVMVVELSLPAVLPGALVALHYTIQIVRPRLGYGSDIGGRREPWIIGGMGLLALGAISASVSIWLLATAPVLGMLGAILSFGVIGVGVGAAGTSLLVLLAQQVAPDRRAAAASLVWVMMIVGFVITAASAGQMLEPFSFRRLCQVTALISAAAFVLTCAAVRGIERQRAAVSAESAKAGTSFGKALTEVWNDDRARNFAIFVFVSMLAYSAQELILEPFAGAVFHLSPGESTKLTGLQNSGALLGMILVAVVGTAARRSARGLMRIWTIGGCTVSALALVSLACAGLVGPAWPLRPSVFVLGMANGAFAVAAIGSMMTLASDSASRDREGTRMGLWGAAQAIAFALGGLLATSGVDVGNHLLGSPIIAYAIVFALEAALFMAAAYQASIVFRAAAMLRREPDSLMPRSALST